jgi:hypothetical protein
MAFNGLRWEEDQAVRETAEWARRWEEEHAVRETAEEPHMIRLDPQLVANITPHERDHLDRVRARLDQEEQETRVDERMVREPRVVSLMQYVEQKFGEDWIDSPEAVRLVERAMTIDEALTGGHEVPTLMPLSVLHGWNCANCGLQPARRDWTSFCCWNCGDADHLSYQCPDKCCWICGYADHLSYVCPDKGCWICGYMDHWSDHCPDNCCWICGDRDHWSDHCPDNAAGAGPVAG